MARMTEEQIQELLRPTPMTEEERRAYNASGDIDWPRACREALGSANPPLDFSQYQPAAFATAIYPREHAIVYPALGLASEAGEVAGKIKKSLRDGHEPDIQALKAELGDVLWYIAALCSDLGLSMQEVAEENLRKLQDRKERDKLKGDGDER